MRKKPRPIKPDPVCPYCGSPAKLVTGQEIYPHRPDLNEKKFWLCAPCDAYVGCHAASKRSGDGTNPLGRLANAELRKAKAKAHEVFDPLWKTKGLSRRDAYTWLAEQLQIPVHEAHIGMFDVELCNKTIDLCERYFGEKK